MRVAAVILLLLTLAACGSKAELRPQLGKELPPAPFGREDRPTADRLLQLPPQAQPERNTELRKRSEERADDPFDLPPPE
ncbi:MAG: hypothetical protein ABWZ75_08620 [Novosphingobium sp.]